MVIAVFSLVIFFLAVRFAQPQEYVAQAVAASENQMALENVASGQAATVAA